MNGNKLFGLIFGFFMLIGIGLFLLSPKASGEYVAGEKGLYHDGKLVFRTDEKITFLDNSYKSTRFEILDYDVIVYKDKVVYFGR